MSFAPASDAARRRMLSPWTFKAYLLAKLPLAFASGLRVVTLDERQCVVRLPGGWRTQNPFRSTYFAAQAMAAEMSTGAPAMILLRGAPASVAMLVRGIQAAFTKKAVGVTFFTFADVAAMAGVIERAAAGVEAESFVARSTGRLADQTVVSEFDVTWSFKRRG